MGVHPRTVTGAATADNSPTEQYSCRSDHDNELWTAQSDSGQSGLVRLKAKHSGAYLATNTPGCHPTNALGTNLVGDGDILRARTDPDAPLACEIWKLNTAGHRFATNRLPAAIGGFFSRQWDQATYRCVRGYNLRLSQTNTSQDTDYYWWEFTDISDNEGYITPVALTVAESNSGNPNELRFERRGPDQGGLGYDNFGTSTQTAQVFLYCDPASRQRSRRHSHMRGRAQSPAARSSVTLVLDELKPRA